MAPVRPVKKIAAEERLDAILGLAKRSISLLRSREKPPSTLNKDLRSQISKSFPLSTTTKNAGKLIEIDALGCDLWNATTNLLREDSLPQEAEERRQDSAAGPVCALRVFAFHLLDAAQASDAKHRMAEDRSRRNVKIGLKACRYCLDNAELELASKILERCADNVHEAEAKSPLVHTKDFDNEEEYEETELRSLVSQFYILRMAHAFKSDRLDLAEHFFDKFSASSGRGIGRVAETCGQTCLDAGLLLTKHDSTEAATKWLSRALVVLNECDVEQLSDDAVELRVAVSSSLVKALLEMRDKDALSRAGQIVEQLELEHGLGNRMAIQLLRLKLLLSQQPVNSQDVFERMVRLFKVPILTDQTFKIIMQAIRKVHEQAAQTAFDALEHYIVKRLIPEAAHGTEDRTPAQDWVERACVALILHATENPASMDVESTNRMRDVLDSAGQTASITFTPKATHAAQTVIWKAISGTRSEVANIMCDLLRHPVFDRAGNLNKARVGRKAITVALAKNDLGAARGAFFQMSATAQNESITRYLAFKIAIQSNDFDFAIECLQAVLKNADRDATFLYACALEAQQSQMRYIAVAALQTILDKRPPGIHLPSLLRCTARLLIGELQALTRDLGDVAFELVRIFEVAAANVPALKQGKKEQWRAEIQWWSKNAYNIALSLCSQIDPGLLFLLLQTCINFIAVYPSDGGPMHDDDLQKRQVFCHFLSAAASVGDARSQEAGSERQLQCYIQAREHITAFKSLQTSATSDVDTTRRSFELEKLDFECILHLSRWDELNSALEACLSFEHVHNWDALADIVLIIHQQTDTIGLDSKTSARMMELLDRIINDTWQKHKDIVKASRWLRLSFSLDLNDGDGAFALKLLAQAAGMARKQMERQREEFPETELQWLATTSFNRAVDLLSEGKHEACMEWVGGALELARYAADNGALHVNLTYKKALVEKRVAEGRA